MTSAVHRSDIISIRSFLELGSNAWQSLMVVGVFAVATVSLGLFTSSVGVAVAVAILLTVGSALTIVIDRSLSVPYAAVLGAAHLLGAAALLL